MGVTMHLLTSYAELEIFAGIFLSIVAMAFAVNGVALRRRDGLEKAAWDRGFAAMNAQERQAWQDMTAPAKL
jgi:hypothetical protein